MAMHMQLAQPRHGRESGVNDIDGLPVFWTVECPEIRMDIPVALRAWPSLTTLLVGCLSSTGQRRYQEPGSACPQLTCRMHHENH
jgi:hypothetical protein